MWSEGKKSGKGSYTYADTGDQYSGSWKDGKRHGHGAYVYASNKTQLVGDWEDGSFVRGKWIHEDGTSYHGSFDTLGRPVGKGLYYHRNGLVQHGEYVVEGKEDEDDDNEESQDPIYVGGEIFESSVNPVDVTHAVHSFLEDVPLKRAEKLSKCIIFEGGPGCRKDAIAAGTAEQLGWISVSAADLVPSGEGESKDADENAVLELCAKRFEVLLHVSAGAYSQIFPLLPHRQKLCLICVT